MFNKTGLPLQFCDSGCLRRVWKREKGVRLLTAWDSNQALVVVATLSSIAAKSGAIPNPYIQLRCSASRLSV